VLFVGLGVDSVGNCYSPGSSRMTDSPAQTIGRPWCGFKVGWYRHLPLLFTRFTRELGLGKCYLVYVCLIASQDLPFCIHVFSWCWGVLQNLCYIKII